MATEIGEVADVGTPSPMTATAERAKNTGRKAAESDSVQRLARLGLISRGLLYGVIGVLAIKVANGDTNQADRHGALRAIGSTTLGRWLLLLVAAGFAGYALWRVAEATVRPGDKKWPSRVASGARALVYIAACATTVHFVVTHHVSNSDDKERDITADVLQWPGGRYLVGAVGLFIAGIGVASAQRAISGRYRKHLKENELPRGTLRWLKPVAYAGMVARAAAFALVGAFLVQAAWTYDPTKARGLDDSLRTVARAPYGEQLILLVGIGLVAFGAWCLVEARYRNVLGS